MSKMNEVDQSQRLDTLDLSGNWVYPSGSQSGHVEIELPTLPGSPNAVERLHARDFGTHVAGKIESSMNRQGYLQTGPQQKPDQTFRHYLACAKGSQLMDGPTIKRMESLAQDFEREPEQEKFFTQVIRPYLLNLNPKRR